MPARPGRHRLISGSCSSARRFVPRFLQTLPRGRALAVPLGCCDQLPGGLPPPSQCPCRAYTQETTRAAGAARRPRGRSAMLAGHAQFYVLAAIESLILHGGSAFSSRIPFLHVWILIRSFYPIVNCLFGQYDARHHRDQSRAREDPLRAAPCWPAKLRPGVMTTPSIITSGSQPHVFAIPARFGLRAVGSWPPRIH